MAKTPPTTPAAEHTKRMIAMLRSHYIADSTDYRARDGGVFAHEVAINGSWGGPGSRRADALYAGFTSASGRILIGHEVKVSKADWRNELKKLDKADTWADACHAWYIVAPSTEIVPPEELPEGWGLMLPPRTTRGKRMQIVVKATVKQDHSPPWWAVRSLMARLDTLGHEQKLDDVKKIVDERVATLERNFEERAQRMSPEDEVRLRRLENVERRLGMSIEGFRDALDEGKVSVGTFERGIRLAALLREDALFLPGLEHDLGRIIENATRLSELVPQAREIIEGHPETELTELLAPK